MAKVRAKAARLIEAHHVWTHEATRDLLSLVLTRPPSIATIASWGARERARAIEWASASHLRASDNHVHVPGRPNCLRGIA